MTDRPEQLPEGRLIALAQKRSRLSGRKSAEMADMSEGHWRAIVSGSRSISAGIWVPVRAPAETLARMAQVVGVTPEQLERANRADAAEELRLLLAKPEPEPEMGGMTLEQAIDETRLGPQPSEREAIEAMEQRLVKAQKLMAEIQQGLAELREEQHGKAS